MDISAASLFLLVCFALPCFIIFVAGKFRRSSRPPGPTRLPIIGNILQIGRHPHRSFADLSKIYGPIMSLKLGSMTTVVVSSPEAAREVLQTHDQVLSSRTVSDPLRALDHHDFSIVWLPPVARWRFLRKISATQLFAPQRLDAMMPLRTKKLEELLNFLKENCDREKAVDMTRAIFITTLNIISNTMFSIDFGSYVDSTESDEFYETLIAIMEAAGKPNISNYFPVLRFLDLQGIRKQMKTHIHKLFQIFQEIIDAKLSRFEHKDVLKTDLLDSLLNLTRQKEAELNVNDIKHLLLDLFGAGIDTNSGTVEWAMAELLRNPEKMVKAQAEINEKINGGKKGVIEESDIPKLSYLQAVVKETLRLHPPAPFLVPRRAESDVRILGFLVSKNAQILVNVWDIGRNSRTWDNPTRFEPERFLGSEIDVKGKNFELTPFGGGRRICPGISLGLKTVHLMLGSLLNSFNWKLQNGVAPEDMDMDETFGITLHKAKPLYIVPTNKH